MLKCILLHAYTKYNSLTLPIHVGCYRYFSYEHFYVIYCKFWELDTDHDFLIDKENLVRYGNHALTYRIVDRIFTQVRVGYVYIYIFCSTDKNYLLAERKVFLSLRAYFWVLVLCFCVHLYSVFFCTS